MKAFFTKESLYDRWCQYWIGLKGEKRCDLLVVFVIAISMFLMAWFSGGYIFTLSSVLVANTCSGVLLSVMAVRVIRAEKFVVSSMSLVFFPWLLAAWVNYIFLSEVAWFGKVELAGYSYAMLVFSVVFYLSESSVERLFR